MTIQVEHTLSKQEARQRIEGLIEQLRQGIQERAADSCRGLDRGQRAYSITGQGL